MVLVSDYVECLPARLAQTSPFYKNLLHNFYRKRIKFMQACRPRESARASCEHSPTAEIDRVSFGVRGIIHFGNGDCLNVSDIVLSSNG